MSQATQPFPPPLKKPKAAVSLPFKRCIKTTWQDSNAKFSFRFFGANYSVIIVTHRRPLRTKTTVVGDHMVDRSSHRIPSRQLEDPAAWMASAIPVQIMDPDVVPSAHNARYWSSEPRTHYFTRSHLGHISV